MKLLLLVTVASMTVVVPGAVRLADAAPWARDDFGVFCIRGHLSLEQKRIEELKTQHGGDVCRLDQDSSEAGAREKIRRMGGAGAECSCE